jgi:Xaa-Pro aminopeptidase
MNRLEECVHKVNQIRGLLRRTGYQGIVINRQANFSWLSAGGRSFIGFASENACADLAVTLDGVYLAGNNIEVPRLLSEELPESFAESVIVPWKDDVTINDVLRRRFGKLTTDVEQDEWFRDTRVVMLPCEEKRYSELGKISATALEDACMNLKQGMTEMEAAGEISERLWAAGVEPITILVAADERSNLIRHYVPTGKKITEGVICSICSRFGGLIASATRTVAFKKDFALRYGKLLRVEEAVLTALHPSAVLGDVFQKIVKSYDSNGLPGEWENHHQGGLTGYLAREIRVSPASQQSIRPNQAFAWNFSARGAKCEDTVFVEDKGIRILTEISSRWPLVIINGLKRPDILRF